MKPALEVFLCPDCRRVHMLYKEDGKPRLSVSFEDMEWWQLFLAVTQKQRERDQPTEH